MALPQLPQIFFFPILAMALPQLVSRLASLGSKNFGDAIAEIQNFLSPAFSLSLSYFVEFRQYRCRNSLSYLNSLNNFEQ